MFDTAYSRKLIIGFSLAALLIVAFGARIATEFPLFVLLDLKMPKVEGLEVLRTVKGDDSLKMIPVVMLTSSSEERDIVESYKLDVNSYMVKPVEFEKLAITVAEIGQYWCILNKSVP
ncbi:response regulator receiver domain protein [Leptospira inadai serovar Lyme str. 10]|uniref:Response regulator receiver domain protein n=1 Tax=Leptospira inadai serovar Lyme str. 10 TaxID=1049790 RepID=V6HAD3_9LEPT|nr:response regulator receiver domain protein [Leptospira inadai serovar Lyme str. 10]